MYLGNLFLSSYPNGIGRIFLDANKVPSGSEQCAQILGGGVIVDCVSVQDCRKERGERLRLFEE